jgi:hypothetical protein
MAIFSLCKKYQFSPIEFIPFQNIIDNDFTKCQVVAGHNTPKKFFPHKIVTRPGWFMVNLLGIS